MLIFLIGARGSGKTTTGRLLAGQMGYSFMDLDEELLESLGETIESFVNRYGWDAFRKEESKCLFRICSSIKNSDWIIATGGGIPLSADNRKLMRDNGKVVWLNVSADDMVERLLENPLQSQRPSLTGQSLQEEVETIRRQREPLYRGCCHLEIDGGQTPEAVCRDICKKLKPKDKRPVFKMG